MCPSSAFCVLLVLCVPITIHLSLLLEKRCADVLQPDITWVGGITEARRIVALASAFDVPVRSVPHSLSPFMNG
jgi:L-alanine-DL-glutamate epimerase-like enolase superfamily enzyme